MGSLTLAKRRDGERAVLALSGELDLATVPVLRDAALAELDSQGCSTLVLELAELSFLDSTGLGCWIELRNHAQEHGQLLELVEVPRAAARTIRIAGLAQLFGIPGT